jgi:hypothetical protein
MYVLSERGEEEDVIKEFYISIWKRKGGNIPDDVFFSKKESFKWKSFSCCQLQNGCVVKSVHKSFRAKYT